MFYSRGDGKREIDSVDGQDRPWRDEFSRDYGRIIHSASFRRLQGKTQVFPTNESDFFRNRLTHSLEVAQIAEGIAERINHEWSEKYGEKIDGTLCATAGLIHDMGHPPFGHNGERALDRAMLRFGGFEGNAQTLRIIARLEKKKKYKPVPEDGDERAGFGLTYRTLAAALKYDEIICRVRKKGSKLTKGYYHSEKDIVDRIKNAVLDGKSLPEGKDFKTIECSIMDLADDIAYSVYDLEDCLKAEFVTPLGMLAREGAVIEQVVKELKKFDAEITINDVIQVFKQVFGFDVLEENMKQEKSTGSKVDDLYNIYEGSYRICHDAYQRTALSSFLVHDFITNVELVFDEDFPQLSSVKLPDHLKIRQEALKKYTYYAAIYSPRVKMGEFRGDDLVSEIFNALMGDKGYLLMPNDVRVRFESSNKRRHKARVVCDFVAGMTDRYAMEFWARLNSDDPESIFKPI